MLNKLNTRPSPRRHAPRQHSPPTAERRTFAFRTDPDVAEMIELARTDSRALGRIGNAAMRRELRELGYGRETIERKQP